MADEEREISIKITGKNLSGPEVEAAARALAGVRTAADSTGTSAKKLEQDYRSLQRQATQLANNQGALYVDLQKVDRLTQQFGGGRAKQSAEEYAAVVRKIGGATKLTGTEQAQVNRVVTTAIEKYRALGQQAPAHLVALQRETAATTKSTSLLETGMAKLAGAFAIGSLIDRAVAGLFQLGRGAIASAGQIADMSSQTGLSIEMTQRLGFVARQNGGSLQQYGDVVYQLGTRVAEGSDKVRGGLKSLGLQYEVVQALRPEEQFDRIMRALAGIERPQERNRIGAALMSDAYKEVAGSVDSYIETMERAPVATEAAIRATDEAADAMSRAWETAEAKAINAIGGIVMAWESGEAARRMAMMPLPGMGMLATLMPDGTASTPTRRDINLGGGGATPPAGPTKEQIAAAAAWQLQIDKLTGASTRRNIAELARQVADAASQGGIMAHEYDALGKQLSELYQQGFKLPPVLDDIRLAFDQTAFSMKVVAFNSREVQAAFKALPSAGLENVTTVSEMTAQLGAKILPFNPKKLPGQSVGLGAAPDPSASIAYGQKLSQTIVSAAAGGGNIGQALGSQIGQDLGNNLASKAGASLSRMFGPTIGGAITAAIPGIGALIGPLAGKLTEKIVGIFTGGEGAKANDLRDQLKAKFGDAAGAGLQAAVDQFGNVSSIQRAYRQFMGADSQADVQGAFDDLQQAIADTNDLLDRHGMSLNDLKSPQEQLSAAIRTLGDDYQNLKDMGFGDEAIATGMAAGLNDLVRSALDAGGKIPAAFQPLIEQLIRGGGLADDLKARLVGVSEAKTPWKEMEQIAKDLNIPISHLGPNFQAAKIGETAEEWASKILLLRDNGADFANVLTSQKDKANEFLQAALKWGVELPPSMKPILEQMQRQGLLTDENGEKLEDLSDVTFGKTLAEEFDPLVEALRDLIDVFNQDLPSSIDTLRRNAGREIVIPVRVDRRDGSGNDSEDDHRNQTDHSGQERPGFAEGALVQGRTMAWIAERGHPEIVGDQGFMTQVVTAAFARVMSREARGSVALAATGTDGPSSSRPLQIVVPINIGTNQMETWVIETTADAMAKGRIPVPQRAVRGQVSRG